MPEYFQLPVDNSLDLEPRSENAGSSAVVDNLSTAEPIFAIDMLPACDQ